MPSRPQSPHSSPSFLSPQFLVSSPYSSFPLHSHFSSFPFLLFFLRNHLPISLFSEHHPPGVRRLSSSSSACSVDQRRGVLQSLRPHSSGPHRAGLLAEAEKRGFPGRSGAIFRNGHVLSFPQPGWRLWGRPSPVANGAAVT